MLRKTGVDRLRDGQIDAQLTDETVTVDRRTVKMATDSRGTDRQTNGWWIDWQPATHKHS